MVYQKKLTFLKFGEPFLPSEVKFQAIMSVLRTCQFFHFAASHYVYEAASVVMKESETENDRQSDLFITFKLPNQTKDLIYPVQSKAISASKHT